MSTTPSDHATSGGGRGPGGFGGSRHGWTDGRQGASGRPAPHRRRVLRWLLPGLGLVLVAGGGAFGATTMRGSATQPDEVVPANAVFFARVDVDPSLRQKVAAVRFLHSVPAVDDVLSGGDFRKELFRKVQQQTPELKHVSYDRDVLPWIGDRMGVAVLPAAPGSTEPSFLLALQVKDEDKARAGLGKLVRGHDRPDVVFRDGYALLVDNGQKSRLVSALAAGRLADNKQYAGDVLAVGEQGVASGWVDLRKVARLSDVSTPAAVEKAAGNLGRTAFALRFDADYLELAGVTRGLKGAGKPTTYFPSHLGDLPADTALAVDLPGPDQIVHNAWTQLDKTGLGMQGSFRQQVSDIESGFGVKLPGDLETVVGKRLLLAAPAQQLLGGGVPTLGLRIQTKAARADAILTRVDRQLRRSGVQLPVRHRAKDGELFVATSNRYLQRLSQHGTLGQDKTFRKAVVNPGAAGGSVFLDLNALESQSLPQLHDKDARAFVKSLAAVGLSASVEDDGDVSFHLRVVGD